MSWIFAIDPGGMTGYAYVWMPQAEQDGLASSIATGQLKPGPFIDMVWENGFCHPNVLFAMERFTITQNSAKLTAEGMHDALDVIGWVKHSARRGGAQFEFQMPSEAKRFVSNEQLKKLGLWVKGQDHARDAVRHLVYAIVHKTKSSLREDLVQQLAD